MTDAQELVGSWRRRLIALAHAPPYAFRDTPQPMIDRDFQRLTGFSGFSAVQVADAEVKLGVEFPAVFRAYLLEMAQSPGDLFRGSDLPDISQFGEFAAQARSIVEDTDPQLSLPPKAVVFMTHQGYTFGYILGTGGNDSPAYQWVEGEREPRLVAPSFAEVIDSEIGAMEASAGRWRKRGGYYKTISSDGEMVEYPSGDAGDGPFRKRWWQFWR